MVDVGEKRRGGVVAGSNSVPASVTRNWKFHQPHHSTGDQRPTAWLASQLAASQVIDCHIVHQMPAAGFAALGAHHHPAVPDMLNDHILHRQMIIGGTGILGGDAHAIVMVAGQRTIGVAIQGETLQSHVICSDDDPLVGVSADCTGEHPSL